MSCSLIATGDEQKIKKILTNSQKNGRSSFETFAQAYKNKHIINRNKKKIAFFNPQQRTKKNIKSKQKKYSIDIVIM